jgi:hypothetical protein
MPDATQQDMSYQPKTQAYAFSTNPVSPQAPEQKPKGKTNPFVLLGLEIAGLVVVFIVFLLVLNFFNIISLSKIYPKQLGSLMHVSQTPSTTNANAASINKSLPTPPESVPGAAIAGCPVSNDCLNSELIGPASQGTSKEFWGLGFLSVSSDAAILAAIDGNVKVEDKTQNGQSLTVVTITELATTQTASYEFTKGSYSSNISSGHVLANQKIGSLKTDSNINFNNKNYSFIFSLFNDMPENYFKLKPSVNGKGLIRFND